MSPIASPELGQAQLLLRRVGSSPLVRVIQRGVHVTIRCTAPDALIARLDLVTGTLTILVAADLVSPVLAIDPAVRVTRDGLRVDLHDTDSRAAGERLIRWRVELERFGAQWRDASP